MKQTTLLIVLVMGWFRLVIGQNASILHQTSFSGGINHIDPNLRLDHSIQWGRHSLRLGGKYNLWWYPIDDSNIRLRLRAYAKGFPQQLGIQVGYGYTFLKFSSGLEASGFYDMQFSHTAIRVRNRTYAGRWFDPYSQRNFPVFRQEIGFLDNASIIEQNIGLALRYAIGRRISVFEMLGTGLAIGMVKDLHGNRLPVIREWIFPFFRLGASFTWNPSSDNAK